MLVLLKIVDRRPTPGEGLGISVMKADTAPDVAIATSCGNIPGIDPAISALNGIMTLLEHVEYNK